MPAGPVERYVGRRSPEFESWRRGGTDSFGVSGRGEPQNPKNPKPENPKPAPRRRARTPYIRVS
eukprot:128062-Pyramimonas_sp.AAC.1